MTPTSIDDSLHLTGLTDPSAITGFYHALGVGTVLVPMGGEGCHLSHPGGAAQIAAAPANPVDSTGAGDSFAGAFIAWWLETRDPVLAARRAAVVAAGAVSGPGAVGPDPPSSAGSGGGVTGRCEDRPATCLSAL